MAKINVGDIATESLGANFDEFVSNFQNNIQNLDSRNKFESVQGDKEFVLDDDGFIIGDAWSEKIAAEVMDLNGFVATTKRLETLLEGREIFGKASLSTDHKVIATAIGMSPADFLKLFPKYPVLYFTRWGNMRKPFNIQELLDNPVRR
jgi:sulfur relay (sulfurtransferase) DsrC/TusE family protein